MNIERFPNMIYQVVGEEEEGVEMKNRKERRRRGRGRRGGNRKKYLPFVEGLICTRHMSQSQRI